MGLRSLLVLLLSIWLLPANGMEGPGFHGHFFLSRYVTGDAYILDIRLHYLKPEQVQVEVQPPWLIIRADHRRIAQQEGDLSKGWRFVRRYRYAQQTRQVTLPPDADTAGLTREDQAGYIRIQVPRRR